MIRRALLGSIAALWALPALAQNVTCVTRAPGDASNACASDAFVQQATEIGRASCRERVCLAV